MHIDRSDRKWLIALFAGVVLITTLPYFIAFTHQGSQWVFSGFFLGVDDGNSYLAKMVSGMDGNWLFRTPYTTQMQNGIIAFLPYLLLGKLAHAPGLHIQLIMLFQLFRVVGIGIYIIGTYQFVKIFTNSKSIRSIGLVLMVFGGGLGWLFPILGINQFMGSIPLEFYSPKSFGFLSLYSFPHLAAARGIIFTSLAVFISNFETRSPGHNIFWLWPGALLFIAGIFQPLSTAIGLALMALYLISDLLVHKFSRGSIRHHLEIIVYASLPALPVILYNGIAQYTDTFFRAWTEQNIITSPHPVHYLLAFAIPIFFILLQVKTFTKLIQQTKFLFLAIWIPVFLALAYIPFNLQRRLPDGIFICLILLMVSVFENSNTKYKKVWMTIIMVMILPSTLIIIANGILSAQHPFEPIFIPKSKADAYLSMSEKIMPGSKILSNFQTGNEFPVWAPVQMIMGHGPESIHLQSVRDDVNLFFNPESLDEGRLAILKKYEIDYVIQENGTDRFPMAADKTPCYLKIDLDTYTYKLYEVSPCD